MRAQGALATLACVGAFLLAPAAQADSERERILDERVRLLEKRLQELETRLGPEPSRPGATSAPASVGGKPPDVTASAPGLEPGTSRSGEAEQETFVFRENAVTLTPGRSEVAIRLGYQNGSGFLQSDRALNASASLRLGLLDWMEIGATIPAFSSRRSQLTGSFSARETDAGGLGDIALQANMRLREQSADYPGVVLSLGGVLPTGATPYRFRFYQPERGLPAYNPNPTDLSAVYLSRGVPAVSGNLQFYKTVDPVILFFGLGARYHLATDIASHSVQPGTAYTYNLGFSFALSEKSTLGFQINGTYESALMVDGRRVPQSVLEPIVARFSLIQRIFPNTYVEPEFSAGLTNSAPNLGLAVGLRHRF